MASKKVVELEREVAERTAALDKALGELDDLKRGVDSTDKERLRKARRRILDRLGDRAHNEREVTTEHVLKPSLPPRDIAYLVSSVRTLNDVLKHWQE